LRDGPVTALRARYERAVRLSLERQTQECIEYLQNPEILVAEFSDSFLMAEAFDHREEAFQSADEAGVPPPQTECDVDVQRVMDAPSLKAIGSSQYLFRFVARDIVPLWKRAAAPSGAEAGLDYVGLTREAQPTPILGVIDRSEGACFLSFLRLLACLAEVATDAQVERANSFLFKGAVPERMPFDLHVLVSEGLESDASVALAQLTHDLAHIFTEQLREDWSLPPLIHRILCMRIPSGADPFTGALREAWKV
jgi:hypothetical protein